MVAADEPLAPPIEDPPAPDAAPLDDDGVDDEEPLLDDGLPPAEPLPGAVEPDPVGLLVALPEPLVLAEPLLPLVPDDDDGEVEPDAEPDIGDTVGLVPADPIEEPELALLPTEPLPLVLPVTVLVEAGFEPDVDDALSMPNACLEPSDAVPLEDDEDVLEGVPDVPIDPLLEPDDEDGADDGVAEDPELLVKPPLEGFTPAIESVSDLPDNDVLEA